MIQLNSLIDQPSSQAPPPKHHLPSTTQDDPESRTTCYQSVIVDMYASFVMIAQVHYNPPHRLMYSVCEGVFIYHKTVLDSVVIVRC